MITACSSSIHTTFCPGMHRPVTSPSLGEIQSALQFQSPWRPEMTPPAKGRCGRPPVRVHYLTCSILNLFLKIQKFVQITQSHSAKVTVTIKSRQ